MQPPSNTSADEYLQLIEDIVITELDKVAPARTCRRRARPSAAGAFLSAEAIASKRQRRRLERVWLRTGSESARIQYCAACRAVNTTMNQSRADMIANSLNCANSKKLKWNALRKLLHADRAEGPKVTNSSTFSQDFSKFLHDKIAGLQLKCSSIIHRNVPGCSFHDFNLPHAGPLFSQFTPVTPAEVLNLINSTDLKSSPTDTIPSTVIKSCATSFSVIIANLANLSFSQGFFSTKFKTAQITPLLKKPSLNPDDLSNYRPISNLSTLSKLLERLALTRLSPHLLTSPSFNPFQSAYRKMHSTETALLHTLSNIYSHIDSGSSVLAVSLDLSAAFDTVPHSTLLSRLQQNFGIHGLPLLWLKSYLADRSQFVLVDGHCSSNLPLSTGVPQGSVLGPLLFSVFTSPIHSLISSFGLNHQQYADDTFIYCPLPSIDYAASLSNFEHCLSTLCTWFADNGLSVNPSKSDAILFFHKTENSNVSRFRLTSLTLSFLSQTLSLYWVLL